MSRRFLKIIPSVLYFICFAALFVMLCNASGILSFAHGIKIAAGTAAVVTGYFSAWFSALNRGRGHSAQNNEKPNFRAFFILYNSYSGFHPYRRRSGSGYFRRT